MRARTLVLTYVGTLAAIIVVGLVVAALATGLPSMTGVLGGVGDEVAGVVDAAGGVLAGNGAAEPASDGDGDAGADGADGAGGDAGGEPNETTSASAGPDTAGTTTDGGTADASTSAETSGMTVGGEATDSAASSTDAPNGSARTSDDTDGTGQSIDDTDGDGSSGSTRTDTVEHDEVNVSAVEQGIVTRINTMRTDRFRPSLDTQYEPELWTVARDHVQDLVDRGRVDTMTPTGPAVVARFEQQDPTCPRVDEYEGAVSLAIRLNYSTRVDTTDHADASELAATAVDAWRNASDALLDADYDAIGVGVRHDNASDDIYGAAALC